MADFLVGSDGSRSICRFLIPEERRKQYFVEYPFAWFGVTIEAKMSSDELIYATSTKGFALISQRSDTIQRWYLQAQPEDDMENWSDDQLFAAFDERVTGDGFQLIKGPITDKVRLPFRSFVQQPMQHGRLVLAGDAAHTVPPTGARGLNLAFSDVRFLCDRLVDAVKANDPDKLDGYERQALQRIWRAENFSYWMTQMMHAVPDENPFHTQRRLAELEGIVNIKAGQTYFAEGYCGWPNEGN